MWGCASAPVMRDGIDMPRNDEREGNEGDRLLRQENEGRGRHDERTGAEHLLAERTMRGIVIVDGRFAVFRRRRRNLIRR